MFTFTSFREFLAQRQAEQDARAQQIADEGSQQTLTVRNGDDAAPAPRENLITIRPDGNGSQVVEGDVPENATLTINDAPVAQAAPAPVEDVAEAPAERNIITIRPDGNGGQVVEGDVPENATLTLGEPSGVQQEGGPVIITGGTQQIDRNPQPEPDLAGEVLEGGEGTDFLTGTAAADVINGNGGRDFLSSGDGNDVLSGGAGRDRLDGGAGDDTFIFNEGDGFDRITNFELLGDDDTIQLNVDGVDNFDDFIGTLSRVQNAGDAVAATFDFGGGDRLRITVESVESLSADDFVFV